MKKNKLISRFVLTFFLFVGLVFAPNSSMVSAATILPTDSFGSTNTNNVPNWTDAGGDDDSDTRVTNSSSRAGSSTTQHARVGDGGYITRTISTVGYQSIVLKYYWHGDDDGDGSSDNLKVYWKKTSDSTYLLLNTHKLDDNDFWSSQVSVSLPASANNTSIDIKFLGDSNDDDDEEGRIDDVSLEGTTIPTTGSLTVTKTAIGGNDTFSMNGSGSIGAFSLTTVAGTASQTFSNLAPGSYTITETVPTSWSKTGDTCTNVAVVAGETATCTITNTYVPPATYSITVVKNTVGGDGTFNFTGDLGEFSLTTVSNTISQTFSELTAGTYSVIESVLSGWTQTSASCSNESNPSSINLSDDVTCTFLNTKDAEEPETGSIVITKYVCPEGTVVTRSANGVVGETSVPEGCVPQSGKTFGYVHGEQTDANGPYPELGEELTAGGSTDEDGVLTISNLPSTGRYLIVETDSENQKIPDGDILGLYCVGDGDTSDNNDNQELTFVPADGSVNCVAYNKAVVEEPQECTQNEASVYVSDETTAVGDGTASAVTPHEAWTASIPGATWIYSEPLDEAGSSPTGETVFTKTFEIVDSPMDSTLDIASDNMYTVEVNGVPLDTGTSGSDLNNFSTADSWTIPATSLQTGSNTISITVTNPGVNPENEEPFADPNPAGLLFKITINSEDCPETEENQPPTADAGSDQTITLPTDSVTLTGSGTDTDGTISLYAWTGAGGTITSPSSSVTTVTGLTVGSHTFTLTVTDNDGATDSDDVTITVNSPEDESSDEVECSDGKDNDEDGAVDMEDPGCDDEGDDQENNVRPTTTGSRAGSVLGASIGPGGQVLGASTSACPAQITKFLRRGYLNDVDAVKQLQQFLNDYQKAGLKVDGNFGIATENALKKFQLTHKDTVLGPWGMQVPTGIFYITSQVVVNNILCPDLKLVVPNPLIPFAENPLSPKKK